MESKKELGIVPNIPLPNTCLIKDSHKNIELSLQISHLLIPRTIQEALGHSEWRSTVQEEMNALLNNRIWEIVDLLKEKKAVGWKWVFIVKCKPDGSIERYKARLVLRERERGEKPYSFIVISTYN